MKLQKFLYVPLATSLLSLPSLGSASNDICSVDSYVVGFFNGVWNSHAEAVYATEALRGIIGDEYNDEPVAYETFYNHTGSSVDATMFQDVAEVFIQRAEEIDPSLSDRFDVFWSAVTGDSDGFLQKAITIIDASNDFLVQSLEDLYSDISSEIASQLSQLLSDPPTASDYAVHNTRVTTLASQGAKLLLVAHSQGNLFVNNAYETAISLDEVSSDNIGVVHVAPASYETKGSHVLADLDLVINSLRAFGLGSVPDVTVNIPVSHLTTDPSGHKFIPTYLNSDLDTYDQVVNHMTDVLGSITAPEAIAEEGAFTATLTWDGDGDVDLHIFEPSNDHVYYSNKTGSVGYLDVDNMDGYGPEHYYTTCDEDSLQTGSYVLGVNNYSGAEGRVATLQVSTGSVADLVTESVTLGEDLGLSGDSSPTELITVTISQDDDGNFFIDGESN